MRCTLGWLEPTTSNEQSDLGIQIKLPQYFLFFSFSPGATLKEAEQKTAVLLWKFK